MQDKKLHSDPYVLLRDQEGNIVLKNKLGLTDAVSLRRFESQLAAMRGLELRANPRLVTGKFDLDHLKKIHRHLFQDTYEWAGQLRTTDIGRGNSKFVPHDLVKVYADVATDYLKQNDMLRGMRKNEFVAHASEYYAKLNEVSPFREGNGKAIRYLLEDVSAKAGYVFRVDTIERNKQLWHRASELSLRSNGGDTAEVRALFSQAMVDSRAYYLLKAKPEIANRKHPELAAVYVDIGRELGKLDASSPSYKKNFAECLQVNLKRHAFLISTGKSDIIKTAPGVESVLNFEPKQTRSFSR